MAQTYGQTHERVHGGTLPDWDVAELPAPPRYQFGKAFRSILGPGIIALGGSIGSGEWLLGPAITAQYGGRLLWIATFAILLQAILNTEAIRYTLYSGEPMLSGYMRCKPGARFWAIFYSVVDFFGIWPGWAMTAATALAAAWLGYMPQDADGGTVRLFAFAIFFICLGIVLFGGKIYNALEKVQLFMVVWIIGYLVIIDLFLVPPSVWWSVVKGFFSFGALPMAADGGQVDWVLLGAFAAYAGSGGLGNVTITNYVRDKGWGMSSLVGVDGVPRRYTDIIWTGFKSTRKLGEHGAKWIYYPILVVYIVWGVIAMYLAKPFFMILVSATVGGYLLVITSLHTLYVNRKFLPPEIQPPVWKQIGLVLCAGFYSIFGTLTVIQKVIVPYILPIFGG